jgi:hypothetical protein
MDYKYSNYNVPGFSGSFALKNNNNIYYPSNEHNYKENTIISYGIDECMDCYSYCHEQYPKKNCMVICKSLGCGKECPGGFGWTQPDKQHPYGQCNVIDVPS